MTTLRTTLAIVCALAFGYAAVALWLLPWLDFGVAVAICAACVIGLELCRAIEKDRERQRDKAIHPSIWVPEGMSEHNCLVYDLKPWPIGDDEVRR